MSEKSGGGSHTVMPKKLAQALMDAGMQHFDFGGDVLNTAGALGMGGVGYLGQQLTGISNGSILNGITSGNLLSGLNPNNIGKNSFQPRDPGGEELAINNARTRQSDVYTQQQQLAQALLAQSQGQGPNPAQAQLAQATGQNVAHQGALMASQRGASANPALIARQAAMQGANVQQQAAGQEATLEAQQQIAAQQALAQQQGNMGNMALNQQGLESGMIGNINNTNAQVASGNAQRQAGLMGGVMQAGGMLGAAALMANKGGKIPGYAGGGTIEFMDVPHLPEFQDSSSASPTFDAGKSLSMGSALAKMHKGDGGGNAGQIMMAGGPGDATQNLDVDPDMTTLAVASKGGGIGGNASVKGDSPKNDTVPALLSPGEIVLPRSVTQGGNIEKKAIEFLKHLKKGKVGFNDVIEARHTKRMCNGGRMK